ncbi:universal stress protein [Luteibacter sp. CQ10]|uniref:universal stress protein n=1 Tax=Luteibacter sp. CQ10 TaxID=2805821 RepID=UPI0034A5979F
MFDNVLLVADGSEEGRLCTRTCIELLARTGGRLHALYVTAPMPAVAMAADLIEGDACHQRLWERAQAGLDEVTSLALAHDVPVVTHHAVDTRSAMAILDRAEKCHCDLIVLPGHSHQARLLRHAARDVIRDAAVPVLVFP